MESLVASLDGIKFDIEIALEEQHGALSLPFSGMDKSIAGVCTYYVRGTCTKGALCPMRHVRGDRNIVCKHWLRGLCKKGDQCEFLHEYDMTKMPECYFYARFNACHNKECPFLHIDPDSKIKDCPWYDRGFCRHGPLCRHHHVRRVLCTNYVAGFCPDGPICKYMHPRFELPASDLGQKDSKKLIVICHFCGDTKHKAMYCDKVSNDVKDQLNIEEINKIQQTIQQNDVNNPQKLILKPLESVTCYKCGTKGHYANKCPKGHLAFLALNQQKDEVVSESFGIQGQENLIQNNIDLELEIKTIDSCFRLAVFPSKKKIIGKYFEQMSRLIITTDRSRRKYALKYLKWNNDNVDNM